MYSKSPYLLWARRFYGTVPFDLAASGIPTVPRDLLGMPSSLENPLGWNELRSALAAYNDVRLDECAVALGTSHALWLAFASIVKPGDEVLLETPIYEPIELKARAFGATVKHFERVASEGYALSEERIARAMTKKTRMVVVTNLHNPSGVRASDETLRSVAELCKKRGATLLVDEVYAPFDDLVDAGGVFRGSARKLADNIVAVSSLTKCYGLGQERIGFLLGPPQIIEAAENAVTLSVGTTPLSHANLATHALSRIGVLAARARKLLYGKREIVEAWVQSRPDLTWSAPEGGLFALVTTRDPNGGDLRPAIEAGIAKEGVIVAAGSFFGVPNGFRISWSLPEEALHDALERLDAVLAPSSIRAAASVAPKAAVKKPTAQTSAKSAPKKPVKPAPKPAAKKPVKPAPKPTAKKSAKPAPKPAKKAAKAKRAKRA